MAVFSTQTRKMKKYNIYSGLGGSFGGETYQYTGLYESEEEAWQDAYHSATAEYESYEGYHGIKDWQDCFNDLCEEKGLDPDSENPDNYAEDIDIYYQNEIESWIEYRAVLTEEDDIDEEDLILNYVIDDDSSSQTCSEI